MTIDASDVERGGRRSDGSTGKYGAKSEDKEDLGYEDDYALQGSQRMYVFDCSSLPNAHSSVTQLPTRCQGVGSGCVILVP